MQLSINIISVFWGLGGFILGGVLVLAILRGKTARLQSEQLQTQQQLAQIRVEQQQLEEVRRDLLTVNSALEQKLLSQQTHYQEQIALLADAKKTLSSEFENLANRIFDEKQTKFSLQSKEAMEVTLSPLRRDIGDFRKQVESAYDKENAERNKLVGQISELQKQTMQVSADAVSLATALRGDNKAQGNWGEFILEKLLEDSGLTNGREYTTQVALKDEAGKRRNPDVIIRLPEGRDIIIDAKVSLVDYERYFHAEDEEAKKLCLRQHLSSLRAHIKGLSRKDYENLEGVNSLDFALIFVPIESAFMLALDHDPEMMRDAYDRGIILVSPSTLMVTLRTIKNLWRYADQNRNAQLIADKAGGLYDQFVLYIESLDEVGKHIEKSQEAWDTAHKRLSSGRGNLIRRTQELKKLGAKAKKSLPENMLDGDPLLPLVGTNLDSRLESDNTDEKE
jgi:DNA recombination protein RmuC